MALYAAYGSNMDPAQMQQRCPSSPMAGTGWLPDWRLTFGGEDLGWEGALATVVPADRTAADEPAGRDPAISDPADVTHSYSGIAVTGTADAATAGSDPQAAVFVVLYDLSDHDERTLDSWEGADLGLYNKIRLRVHTLEGDRLAWLYALDAFEGGLPSARYLGVIADAAEAADAPAEYVRSLRHHECRSIGN